MDLRRRGVHGAQKMIRLKRALFVRSAAAAVLISAVRKRASAQTASPLTTVRLGFTLGDDGVPIVYGQKAGIFAKHGLDLQLTRLNSGAAITSGLLGGTFDFGKASITTLLAAHEKGLGITVVAGAILNNLKEPYAGFLVRKDSPIESGKGYNNQLVGVPALGDIGSIALMKWVDEHGGDWQSIKFVEIPTAAAAAALDQNRVVAAESGVPMIAAATETGRARISRVFESIGNGALLVAWATTHEFSTKHPELVRAFARAWRESATYTNAHHAETVDMMAEFTGFAPATIAKMSRVTSGLTLTPTQIQPLIDASVKYGILKAPFTAADMIDPNAR
jgi:NitT/TauT family transport system substrate-binding protein